MQLKRLYFYTKHEKRLFSSYVWAVAIPRNIITDINIGFLTGRLSPAPYRRLCTCSFDILVRSYRWDGACKGIEFNIFISFFVCLYYYINSWYLLFTELCLLINKQFVRATDQNIIIKLTRS